MNQDLKFDQLKITISSEKITEIITDILKDISYICEKENIEFFAYGEILRHAVHYHQLLPYGGDELYEVGFLRDDYERFIKTAPNYAKERGFQLETHPIWDLKKKYRAHLTRMVKKHTDELNGMKVENAYFIDLCPFDKVPESVDTYSGFARVMQRASRKLEHITDCRYFIEGGFVHENKHGKKFRSYLYQNLFYRGKNSKKAYDKMQEKAKRYQDSDSQTYQRVIMGRTAAVTEQQLHPLRYVLLGDIEIPIPNDFSPWTEIFKDEHKERIEQIQKIDLMLLKEFDRVCREIGVGYFLCGGSMLGYVRHGGFIPWDDDVDCGMMREDYEKFLAHANKYLDQKKYFLQTRESDPSIPYLFSKIRMNHTTYITEYNKDRAYHKGICLDIFPFDYIPEGKKEQKDFFVKVKHYARQHHFIANRQKGNPPASDVPKTARDRWYRFLGASHRRIFRLFPLKVTQKRYDRFVTQYNAKAKDMGLTTVGSFVPTYTWAKVDTLKPYKTIDFEGVQAMVPNKPEIFLEMQYGDFMTPPPSHLQIGHELIEWSADWDKIAE